MEYGYQLNISKSFDEVDKRIRLTLLDQGFGVITEIDIKSTFKEKLNIDYKKFKILGACNPQLAKKALDYQEEVAMLMPCNVIFWENNNNSVTISSIDAYKQLLLTKDSNLIELGKEVNQMLKIAINEV